MAGFFQFGVLKKALMPYVPICWSVMQKYFSGNYIYMDSTAPVNYRVAATVADPPTGEINLTNLRESRSKHRWIFFYIIESLSANYCPMDNGNAGGRTGYFVPRNRDGDSNL